ncbi:MAG TPA: PD-(D/E)XK nuclease family protein [Ktedonobacterales bacterium]
MDRDELELAPDLRDDDQQADITAATAGIAPKETLALSHSQVETFSQCPRRWWLLKRAGVRRAPSESLILGLAVHTAIEVDLRARLEGEAHPMAAATLDAPLAAAFAALYAEEDPTGLIAPDRRELLQEQGRAVLRAYERIASRMRPVEIEREFAFPHPDDPSITFTGRMDGVTQPDHGTQERTIVDWKVPRRPWQPGEEDRRIQAAAYLWAEARMGWERSARFTFVTFPPADPRASESNGEAGPRTVDARPTYRTPGALNAYARLVRDTAARIRELEPWGEEGFPARTSGLCPWCEVRGACPTGQRYVRTRGLTPRVPELPPEPAAG